ncbi:MAG: cysteine desulfurase [Bacteroidetes bacterium]|nr:cysteine desulfurase [Bacteroidota bacterium]
MDIRKIREQFPILAQQIYGKPLVYFDNAATTQKPLRVINKLTGYYSTINSNIHRGVHRLSQEATEAYESARLEVKKFLNAASAHEVIFTRGTTEAINLVAFSFGKKYLNAGDEILLTGMEHHSNIVPWQMIAEEKGAFVKHVPVDDRGCLDLEDFRKMITPRTKIVALTHVSNALGTINPVREVIELAHSMGVPVLIDGAQAASHIPVDVQAMDCDFYCLSGHKMYGPTGIGVLYGKEKWLDEMPPYQGGGDMIDTVSFEKTTYAGLPLKFEAGTQNIGDAIALKEAILFLSETGLAEISRHEDELLHYATEKLIAIGDVTLYGTAPQKTGVLSFLINGVHPYDAGTIIDKFGVAVRTGHHCAQPLIDRFQIPGTVRASFAVYNTKEEVDVFITAVRKAKLMLL